MHRKIVLIAHIDDPLSGGGRCIINQCRALGESRIKAVILFKGGDLSRMLQQEGLNTYVFPQLMQNPIQWFKFLWFFVSNFDRDKHYVHTHTERTSALLNPLLRIVGYKVITTIHRSLLTGSPWGSGLKSKAYLYIENCILKYFTNMIVPVSGALKDELIEIVVSAQKP